MKKLQKADLIIVVVILLLVAGIVLSIVVGTGKKTTAAQDPNAQKNVTYADFNGKRIGIRTGTSFEELTFKYFPDSQYFYFDTESDLVTALTGNKIDAFLNDEPVAEMMHIENPEVDFLKPVIVDDDYSFAFPKNKKGSDKLLEEFNEVLAEVRKSGDLDKMKEKWLSSDNSGKVYDKTPSSGENGTITVCVVGDKVPFSYMYNNELTGYNIELITIFAREKGYNVKFEMNTTSGMLAGLSAGKYDIGAGLLSVTEERKKAVNFSDCIYKGGVVLVGRTDELGSSAFSAVPDYKAFDGKKVGLRTGSAVEPLIPQEFPSSEKFYYESDSDMIAALKNNKIDFFLTDEPVARLMHSETPDIDYIKAHIVDDDYYYAFQKGTDRSKQLREQFNNFLKKCSKNGTLDRLKDKWVTNNTSQTKSDKIDLTGENGKIKVCLLPDNIPFSYTTNNELDGYCVELTNLFAKEYGYKVEFEQTTLISCLAGVSSGKYDMLAYTLSYTEERAQSVDYSDVYYNGGIVLVARSTDINSESAAASTSMSFFNSIAESFEKNFVKEARYQLIVEGIGTTAIITVLSVMAGSILAFFICLFRRVNSVLSGKICDLYVKFLQGTPMIVLLMMLYYVIFGKSGINAIWVAVIGFSLNFSAYASEILRSGIESIDGGQREAALALGLSENQAFFKFIFPQAALRQMPVYRGEIITLLKNTSIVGYIAIQDLTKMSDIIRSRTYEAFFPLIATAVIYFILAWIIALILKFIFAKIDPKAKRARAKEVKA